MRRFPLPLLIVLVFILGVTTALAQNDSDRDGIPDNQDSCPTVPGVPENRGCPPTSRGDSDGDGIPDADDQCPTVPGVPENRGCPAENPSGDTDGDGLPDSADQCPTVFGPRENGGCPTENPPPREEPGPNDPPSNDPPTNPPGSPPSNPPPFNPPVLPTDGCYITPFGDYSVNVRESADVSAALLGHLLPGVVYAAEGYVTVDASVWFVTTSYENSTGTAGYAAGNFLLSSNCGEWVSVGTEPETGGGRGTPPRGFTSVPPEPPTLCHFSVGFDSPTWSEDPEVPSVTYAAFYFESEPGVPILAGTPVWGVIYVADFITLPDAEGSTAVAPNPALYEEALNSEYAGAYNWPTLAGGIQSGDVTLYRLTTQNEGACGPIVGIDDFTFGGGDDGAQTFNPPINEYACTITTAFNWVFAFNFAPGENVPPGTHPLAILNGDMNIAGDVNNWFTELIVVGNEVVEYMSYPGWAQLYRTGGTCGVISGMDAFARVPSSDVAEMQCATQPGTTLLNACWCNTSDSDCVDQLVDICYGGGAYIEEGPDTTACWWDDNAAQAQRIRYINFTMQDVVVACGDNFNVWWMDVPADDSADGIINPAFGNCTGTFEGAMTSPLAEGHARLIIRNTRNILDPIGNVDCDANGIPDMIQMPVPDCAFDFTSDDADPAAKEDPDWWETVLDLTCPGDWIMIIEIDADGDEVVTDAQCWEDID